MKAELVVVESGAPTRRTVVGSARSQDELKRVLERAKNYDGVYYLIDGEKYQDIPGDLVFVQEEAVA